MGGYVYTIVNVAFISPGKIHPYGYICIICWSHEMSVQQSLAVMSHSEMIHKDELCVLMHQTT